MKKLLLKSILLLCALVVGTSAWATDLTLDLSSNTGWTITNAGTSGTGSAVEMSKDGITINASKGYWEGSQLRVYSGSTFVVTSSIGNISQIALTFTGSKTGPLSGYTEGTATVSPAAASYESSASGQARIVRIVVTYTAGAVANPIFDPAAGAVEKGTTVSITTATAGATIHYTTDGSNPTSSSTTYSSAITINTAQTIKAIAVKGSDESEVVTAAYTIKKVETPTFTVAEGDVIAGTTVEIETATAGATIHYTTDGSTPTSSSTTYSSAITINADMTIKAIAVKTNWDDSEVASADYTLLPAIPGLAINFEAADLAQYVDWEFENVGNTNSAITAHGGSSKYGANINGDGNGVTTCSITTKNKIAYPGSITFYVSKVSSNTTDSYWYVEVSENGSVWTQVGAAQDAKSMNKGTWVEVSRDLTSYNDVYVRIRYGSSNAIRAVDNISLRPAIVPANISSVGWNTFSSPFALDFNSYTDANAYMVTAASGSTLTLAQVTGTVPANTGLLLSGTASDDVDIPTAASSTTDVTANKLKPGTGTAVNAADKYVLVARGGKAVFAPTGGSAATVAVGKAYLDLEGVSLANGFVLDDSETTGINNVNCETLSNNRFFDMQGREVVKPTKGLYIVNGKKVIIK